MEKEARILSYQWVNFTLKVELTERMDIFTFSYTLWQISKAPAHSMNSNAVGTTNMHCL